MGSIYHIAITKKIDAALK